MEELKRPEYYTEEEAPNPRANFELAAFALIPYVESKIINGKSVGGLKKDAPPIAKVIYEDLIYWGKKMDEYRAKGGAY